MPHDNQHYPVAISRISEDDSRELQNVRAIQWLLIQQGGPVVVVTPQKHFSGDSLKRLIARPSVTHLTWRGFSTGYLENRRVIFGWPDRQRLNDLWGARPDALVVLEHGGTEAAEWIADNNPIQLLNGQTLRLSAERVGVSAPEPLPNGVDAILEHVAVMAAGYSPGLKWNEEDMLKADMMNRPDRWEPVTAEQVRAKCRELNMRPNDIDTVAGYLQRRKEGGRFNVRSSYRGFQFS